MGLNYQQMAIRDVRRLHSERRLDGDGFTAVWCVECRQNWPCATITALIDADQAENDALAAQGDDEPF